MILITGASGQTGGAVLRAAIAANLPVRAMYQKEADAANAPTSATAVLANYADRASLNAAVSGIDVVYLVCGPIPQLIELEGAMIDACVDGGVKHIVLNSALGAGKFDRSFPSWHHKVEQKLESSGLNYSILRPNGFMQNMVTYNAQTIRTQGAFYAAMGDAKVSLIDVRDVAAVAATIFANPAEHAGNTYELCGPAAFSNAEIAAEITRVLGEPVSYVDIPEEAQKAAMTGAGMPDWQVTAILELQAYYRTGDCAFVDGIVRQLTGRPERTLEDFLSENAASFRTGGQITPS